MVTAPTDIPNTVPELFTVATDTLLELHEPPVTPSVSPVEPPTQTVLEPVIVPADAVEVTVTGKIAKEEPQVAVTV